jgi:hypothetical protein
LCSSRRVFVMLSVSCIGILKYKSLMSKAITLRFLSVFSFTKSLARVIELGLIIPCYNKERHDASAGLTQVVDERRHWRQNRCESSYNENYSLCYCCEEKLNFTVCKFDLVTELSRLFYNFSFSLSTYSSIILRLHVLLFCYADRGLIALIQLSLISA